MTGADPRPENARRAFTYADVEHTPEGWRAELLRGELRVHPRPGGPHAVAASGIQSLIGSPFHFGPGPGGWWLITEPELKLDGEDSAVIPDLAGWRRERMPDGPVEMRFTITPDWVCEVLSPRTAGFDRGAKSDHYAEVGVRHMWIVDPDDRTLEAYVLQGGSWVRLLVASEIQSRRIPPFDAVELSLAPLWIPRRKPDDS